MVASPIYNRTAGLAAYGNAVSGANNPLSTYAATSTIQQNPMDQAVISQALQRLGNIHNPVADEIDIRLMGIVPPFRNGREALARIRQKGIRVEFGDMGNSPAHAQWIADQNLIMINQRYRGDFSSPTLCAIAAAIYHEAGHASGNGDDQSSIQEELNCLALNVLGHRYFEATDPAYAHASSTSPLLADGVALYPKLFFDPDPNKQALINRVIQKYGDLPMWSPGHPVLPPTGPFGQGPRPFIYQLAAQLDALNTQQGLIQPSAALQMAAPGAAMTPLSTPPPMLPSPPVATGQQLVYTA